MPPKELPIPDPALRDPNAVEMIRAWIAEKGLHCSIHVGMYHETTKIPEEKAWARILADVARHVSNALSEGYQKDSAQSLQLIREMFEKEFDEEPLNLQGGFVRKH